MVNYIAYFVYVGGGGWSSWSEGVCMENAQGERVREDRRICTTLDYPHCCSGLHTRISPCPGMYGIRIVLCMHKYTYIINFIHYLCMQLTKTHVAEMSCISCYCFFYIFAHDQFTRLCLLYALMCMNNIHIRTGH